MELLEKHFEIALETPDGIKKLRELILSLAMQGKLVPQDPNDQPASELLRMIEIEKKKLINEGKIIKQINFSAIKPEEIPYEIPNCWEWVQLTSIGEINPRNNVTDELDAGFVPMPLIFADYGVNHKFEIKKWSEIKKGYTHFADQDIALAKITPCFENGKSCVFQGLPNGLGAGTTELHIFRNTYNAVFPRYLLAYLKNPKYIQLGKSKMTGSAGQKRVPTEYFAFNPFPLPPITEQKRIVEKIDQLMALCDKLETERNERNSKRLKIHTAAINKLLAASDKSEFNKSWDFITKNFSELYSVPENAEELKKAILQLAVMGKLVPQDPKDQPILELLNEIDKKKTELVKERNIKKMDSIPLVEAKEFPFEIPKTWKWVRLGNILSRVDYGTSKKTMKAGAVPIFTMGHLKNMELDFNKFKYLNRDNDEFPYLFLSKNDIIFNRTNSWELVGKSAVFQGENSKFSFASYLIRLRLIKTDSRFINYIINSPYFRRTQIETQIVQQCGQANFNGTKLRHCVIPLPPLEEQKRIVAKIDQLLKFCNTLQQQLSDSTKKKTAILNSVLQQY